ncbi:capsule assembly Wzi family protein [Algoriphagus taiwanensis]
MQDFARREQVYGNLNESWSFNYKPLPISILESKADSLGELRKIDLGSNSKFNFRIYPLENTLLINTGIPFEGGAGPLIPSKGIQNLISGGIFLQYGKLSIQLTPQIHYAQNLPFQEYPENAPTQYFSVLRRDVGGTEKPVRFTDQPVFRILPGNSNILFNFGAFATGVSTENIWWGPGQLNGLHISDNANGFLHGTFRTTKPARTFLGNFEGQYFMGRLDGYGGPYFSDSTAITLLPIKEEESYRYFTGISISYNPKWVKGLFIGASRTFQIYREDMEDNLRAWFPIFDPLPKEGTGVVENILLREDQHFSVFTRYVVPTAKAEFYFEYLRNDHSLNWRDFLLNPEHSRAYLIGFSKAIPYDKGGYFYLRTEYTHTQAPINNIVRPGGEGVGVYYNGQVVQGLTQNGEVLGSSIGQSGNQISLEIRKAQELNSMGLLLQRTEREANFETNLTYAGVDTKPWVDLSIGVFLERKIKNLLVSGQIKAINTRNHLWNQELSSSKPTLDGSVTNSMFSTSSRVKVAYFF